MSVQKCTTSWLELGTVFESVPQSQFQASDFLSLRKNYGFLVWETIREKQSRSLETIPGALTGELEQSRGTSRSTTAVILGSSQAQQPVPEAKSKGEQREQASESTVL